MLENLDRILVTDFKVDREDLRRMYLIGEVEVDGNVIVENDVYFNPKMIADTSRPHVVKIGVKKIVIPKRTEWENDTF